VVARPVAPAPGTRPPARRRPRRRTLFRVGGVDRGANWLGRPARHRRRRGNHQAESIRPTRSLPLARGATVSATDAWGLPPLVGGGRVHAAIELRRPVRRQWPASAAVPAL